MPSAHVYIGKTSLENLTPCSLTAVGQRRDTTVATRTKVPGRGATFAATLGITGRTAELITVVRILKDSTYINTHLASNMYPR